jgi:folate-binding protein YgfZ
VQGHSASLASPDSRPFALYNWIVEMISTSPQDKLIPARREEYVGPVASADFGDPRAEFHELLTGCGVYELSWRAKATLTGSDRVRWLNGIVTNNIRDLSAGNGAYAFLLNPQGRILGDLYAYVRVDSLLIDTDVSQFQKVLGLFDHYIIMDDVEVSDSTRKIGSIGVKGPESRQVLHAAGLDFPELQPLNFVDITWRNIALTVVRSDGPIVESYEMWASPETAHSVRHALEKSGARPVGTTALNCLRIAEGIPQYGQDIRERDLPQETQQQHALHFTKGCYIGQEIVERIRSRGNVHRTFTGFTVEGPLPPQGTKIQIDGKDIGEITSSASLPVAGGEYPVALGYIRREVGTPGKLIELENMKLTITNLPFAEVFKQ